MAIALAGCPGLLPPSSSIRGSVAFPSGYRTLATSAEVGTGATVSLIDPLTDRTIATTLTDASGSFSLSIGGFRPQVQAYVLEAIKGLSTNRAGFDAARLRTVVHWNGTNWRSIVTTDASIRLSTTALAAVAWHRRATVNPETLIGTVSLGSPDTFADAGTGISQSQFGTVVGLATQALTADWDPIDAIVYDGTNFSLKNTVISATFPYISTIRPNPASVGTRIVIAGGNFDATPASNSVSLNGLTIPIESASSVSITVTLPSGASSGPLEVATSLGTASHPIAITPAVAGGVLPLPAPSLPATTPGTDIPGSVFGR